MAPTLVFVSGFGAFETTHENPSAFVAEALQADPPDEVDVASAVLPASFARSAEAFDEALRALGPRRPALFLALGVRSRGGTAWKLEQCARALRGGRADVDGRTADGFALSGGERRTQLALEELRAELLASGADEVEVSTDAGGFVCERIYHHVLGVAAERRVPAVFLHVPPATRVPAARQAEIVAAFVPALVRRAVPAAR